MRTPRLRQIHSICLALLALVALASITACSIHEEKSGNGESKKVDISTPFGGVHVATNTDAKDTGLNVYPGATRRPSDEDGDHHAANVTVDTGRFGVRVVAMEFNSSDPPDKVIDFYRKDLKRYGQVLECKRGLQENKHGMDDKGELKCSESGREEPGKLDLAVGVPDHQHVVSVKPDGTGTRFGLVYVQMHGRESM